MQFAEGAKVFTADGERVGTIDRVVLKPDTKEVTHLVIKKGFLFTEDKVVPLSLVGPATDDRVTLREDAGDLEKLPDFEETNYIPAGIIGPRRDPQPVPGASNVARPLYFYPPLGAWWRTTGFADYAKPRYVAQTEKHIPEGTVALEKGAKVIGMDGEHIGDVERIFTDSIEDRATHLLIAEGLILKEKKLIPTGWMSTVLEDEVHLSVNSDLVENLPEYQPPD